MVFSGNGFQIALDAIDGVDASVDGGNFGENDSGGCDFKLSAFSGNIIISQKVEKLIFFNHGEYTIKKKLFTQYNFQIDIFLFSGCIEMLFTI